MMLIFDTAFSANTQFPKVFMDIFTSTLGVIFCLVTNYPLGAETIYNLFIIFNQKQ